LAVFLIARNNRGAFSRKQRHGRAAESARSAGDQHNASSQRALVEIKVE
jgi:hypothetical protein